jgi:site-specific recombinase XerD
VLVPKAIVLQLKAFVGTRSAGPVFLANDRRISMRHAQRRLAAWLTAAKITGKSAHALRHTFATRIYQHTGDILVTQQALGHASVASTVIYARVNHARLREAVGA